MTTVRIMDPVAGRLHVSAEVLGWEAELLLSMGRAYHYRAHLAGLLQGETAQMRFVPLGFLHDSCFLRFVMDWCKIFGRNAEKVHWLKLYSTTGVKRTAKVERFKAAMTRALAEYSGVSAEEFAQCREAMLRARDRFIAHLDMGRLPPMPFLDPAYRVADALSRILAQQDEVVLAPLAQRARADEEELSMVIG